MAWARSSAWICSFILTGSQVASAGCAWVLWQEISVTERGYNAEYGVSVATYSEQQCRREAATSASPDTVDPRVPKTGGR